MVHDRDPFANAQPPLVHRRVQRDRVSGVLARVIRLGYADAEPCYPGGPFAFTTGIVGPSMDPSPDLARVFRIPGRPVVIASHMFKCRSTQGRPPLNAVPAALRQRDQNINVADPRGGNSAQACQLNIEPLTRLEDPLDRGHRSQFAAMNRVG